MAKVIGINGKAVAINGSLVGDSNLSPENIKKNVNIFGVTGTYEGGGGGETQYNIVIYNHSQATVIFLVGYEAIFGTTQFTIDPGSNRQSLIPATLSELFISLRYGCATGISNVMTGIENGTLYLEFL